MAKQRWNKKSLLARILGGFVQLLFGSYTIHNWKRKKLRGFGQLMFLMYRDTIATLTGEIRGFGEWRKMIYLKRHGRYCSECGTDWEESSLEFHHRRPLKAIQKVFFNTPLKLLPTFLVIILANMIANRLGNIQLLCLKCHYKAHVHLSNNGYTHGAVNLVKSKLKNKGIPIPRT